jgi:hypothetical protein
VGTGGGAGGSAYYHNFYIIDVTSDSGKPSREMEVNQFISNVSIGREMIVLDPLPVLKDAHKKMHKLASSSHSSSLDEHWHAHVCPSISPSISPLSLCGPVCLLSLSLVFFCSWTPLGGCSRWGR